MTATRYLQIDPEGYWISEGVRLGDEDYGRELLAGLRSDNGRFFTDTDGQAVAVEAFDEPLVALMVERKNSDFTARFPYGHEEKFRIPDLCVDEWDRFHGRTARGVPFVLSRPAQAELFNLVDDYDDEALIVGGERVVLEPWLLPAGAVSKPDFWAAKIGTPEAGWELGREHVVLPDILPQLKLPRSRILVLGAGQGHDAAFLARAGHLVTAVDFTAAAIELATKNYGDVKDLKIVQADAFKLPDAFTGNFDIVLEHTMYCAISPDRRRDLVRVWRRVLADGGHLLGIFFVFDKRKGPPWGGSEWEIREQLRGGFDFRFWTRWRRSVETRQNAELVVWAQKKES